MCEKGMTRHCYRFVQLVTHIRLGFESPTRKHWEFKNFLRTGLKVCMTYFFFWPIYMLDSPRGGLPIHGNMRWGIWEWPRIRVWKEKSVGKGETGLGLPGRRFSSYSSKLRNWPATSQVEKHKVIKLWYWQPNVD